MICIEILELISDCIDPRLLEWCLPCISCNRKRWGKVELREREVSGPNFLARYRAIACDWGRFFPSISRIGILPNGESEWNMLEMIKIFLLTFLVFTFPLVSLDSIIFERSLRESEKLARYLLNMLNKVLRNKWNNLGKSSSVPVSQFVCRHEETERRWLKLEKETDFILLELDRN